MNDEYPNPAKSGELRWYATVDGQEHEFESGEPIEHDGEIIYPRSRTFIPAQVQDNPYYAQDNRYISVLQSLPEPLRSMLLNGDFKVSSVPNPFQVIPAEWVRLAQQKWLENEKPDTPLTAVGVDAVRGGNDQMAVAKRYDNWFDEVKTWPGAMVPNGATAAELVRQELGDEKPGCINVDVIGVGSTTYDSLEPMYSHVYPINASSKSYYRDRSGKLKMRNMRAEYYWRMRDGLDPKLGDDVALPEDMELLADLCSATYKVSTAGVLIEEKKAIKERIGRSPDKGESVMLANLAGQGVITVRSPFTYG